MRALTHVGFFADVVAGGEVEFEFAKPKLSRGVSSNSNASAATVPPATNGQSDDPNAPNFTYAGFESASPQLMLWRPIFDGLSRGTVNGRGGE